MGKILGIGAIVLASASCDNQLKNGNISVDSNTQRQEVVAERTLKDILSKSRSYWIETYAKDFAEEEKRNVRAEDYVKASERLGDTFLVNESDTSLGNLFNALSTIAHREEPTHNGDVIYSISNSGVEYSVKNQIIGGEDEVSVSIGDIWFNISNNPNNYQNESRLSHYGSEIPKDILTQLLNSKVDTKRLETEKGYPVAGSSGGYGSHAYSPADPKEEFWARTFPGSMRAAKFDDRYGTNYSGGRNSSRDMSAKDIDDAKWGRGKYVGKTGDVFIDDPFFNPWAPGGKFNKK